MMKQRLAALIGIISFCLLGRADEAEANALKTLKNGRDIFRFDTFGDQAFWGDTLKLHQAIEGTDHGGIGPGVSPSTALAVGLKVDVEALPQSLKQKLAAGQVDLNDPANTLALLKLNAVVGVTGFFDPQQRLSSLGIQCALCHSTVDNSFALGIGQRLDGWPNRDLNVGAIINLSLDLSPFANALQVDEATVRTVLQSWGPGKFDAALLLDGKAFRPDGKSAATLIPAAFGLANSIVSGNSALYYGGGIHNSNGTVTVSNGALSGNAARFGGGIYNSAGTVVIDHSTLTGNTANPGLEDWFVVGGGIFNDSQGTVTGANDSHITGNLYDDVNNLSLLYRDGTSAIGILNGNPAISF
jgi:hypothetical protein